MDTTAAPRTVDDEDVTADAPGGRPEPDVATGGVAVVGAPAAATARRRRVRRRADDPDHDAGPGPDSGPGAPADGGPVAASAPTATASAAGMPGEADGPVTARTGRQGRRAGSRRRSPGRPLVAGLAALAVVGAGAGVGFGVAWSSVDSQQQTQQQVQATVRTFVRDFTNSSPKTMPAWERALLSISTGQFAVKVRQLFGHGVLSEIEAANLVQQGKVWAEQVQSITGSTATASAVVDDRYDDTPLQAKGVGVQSDVLWMTIHLRHTAAGWRVDSVQEENGTAAGIPGTQPVAPSSGAAAGAGSGSS